MMSKLGSSKKFEQIFTQDSEALAMGLKLRGLIATTLNNIQENIVGGAKVKLALYSRNGPNNVLCGVQQGAKDTCMFYVHHVPELKHERLKFSGKGKHAKRIKFEAISQIHAEDIVWLLDQVESNAPF